MEPQGEGKWIIKIILSYSKCIQDYPWYQFQLGSGQDIRTLHRSWKAGRVSEPSKLYSTGIWKDPKRLKQYKIKHEKEKNKDLSLDLSPRHSG